MKIAVISNGASALLNFRAPLLIELRRRGHDVLAFAPDHDAASRTALIALGVQPCDYRLARTGTNPFQDFATIIDLRHQLKRVQPDICFASFIKPAIYGTIAAWLAGVKRRYAMLEGLGFTFTEDGRSTLKKKALALVVFSLMRFALARATRVIVLNKDDYQELRQQKLVHADKCEILGGIGVDLKEWSYSVPPVQPVTFILVGRLLWDKGIKEFVEAAQILRRSHSDVKILLVGGRDQNPAAVPPVLIERWRSDKIIDAWPGHVPVRPWLNQSSVFVLPSYREGVPRSTQEAMALGLPIITTDVPGCRDTVIEGVNGFLVAPRDPVALANAMKHFVVHPEDIISMGRESRRLAEERFDIKVQNEKLMTLIGLGALAT